MSIFKRLYGRRIPPTKIPDAENPGTATTGDEEKTTPTVVVEAVTSGPATTEPTTEAAAPPATTETQTTTPDTATNTETTTPPTTTTGGETTTTSNGAPRSFQFGAKAKILRDMIAQHRVKLLKGVSASEHGGSPLTLVTCLLGVAIACSLGAIGTTYWQCQGDQHYGLWNTCQRQTALSLPADANGTDASANATTVVLCLAHNKQNELELAVAPAWRVDQVQASQGLIICGALVYLCSLVALVLAARFGKLKPTTGSSGSLNTMRNLLVAAIGSQLLALLLQLVGFFLYLLTERVSISVGILFVYFGLGVFLLPAVNFFTIEYKAYRTRKQHMQIN